MEPVCCAQASSAAPGLLEQQEALAHSPFSEKKKNQHEGAISL